MLDMMRSAMTKMNETYEVEDKVLLLSPSFFSGVARELGLCSGLVGGRFKFCGVLVVRHEFLPPESGYLVDLDEAEKFLGYRPKL